MTIDFKAQVIVFGGINMDLVTFSEKFPESGETVVGTKFLQYAGGKGANQAVAAARMGAQVKMVGKVGDDDFGDQLLRLLDSSRVEIDGVSIEPNTSSGLAIIEIDSSSQNRIIQILGANDTCDHRQVNEISKTLHRASVLMLQLEVNPTLSLETAQEARAQGKTVILDPGPVRPIPRELLLHSSVITPNETEAEALVGFSIKNKSDAVEASRKLLQMGPTAVVIKLGSAGSYFTTEGDSGFINPFNVNAVDSVGAGDAFNGALAVGLGAGLDLRSCVEIASAAGALAVTKTGAQDSMPMKGDVDRLLGN